MKKFKKTIPFILVLTMLISTQALGFNFKELQAHAASGSAGKNYAGALLQSIDTKNLNPDYVSIENRNPDRNSRQVIKIGLSADLERVSSAVLSYQLEGTNKVLMQGTSDIQNGYITFTFKIDSGAAKGIYDLLETQLKSKDGSLLNTVDLRSMAASYAVGSKSEAASNDGSDKAAPAQAADASAVVSDKGKTITGAEIGTAVSAVRKAMKSENGQISAMNTAGATSNSVKAASGITIVLDPGHGGTDSGAVANGYAEKDLNLKIAQYAKAELETYAGVTVGMTRTSDMYLDLATRASVAKQQGANILVSIHNNASSNGQAYGSEVWVSVLKAYSSSLTILGNIILDELHALGLYDRGVKVRPSESGTIFSLTGELADYYGIIRESAYCGFPGIIVEHCFLDNASDAQKYLSSDAKLKQLGIADATALAEYYGLVRKNVAPNEPVNLAAGILPTSSEDFTNMAFATDGDSINYFNYADSFPSVGPQWVQLDLGSACDVNHINLWHFYGDRRVYHDVVVQLSKDPTFSTGVTTVYNNDRDNSAGLGAGNDWEYAEASSGLALAFNPVNARYARFYSNGSSENVWNHYVEIEIFKSDANLAIHPYSVTLNKTSLSMMAGGTDTLTAYVLPENASDKDVYWSSSDDNVATVNGGNVTAKAPGNATITATTVDGLIKASCTVTVTPAFVPVTGVKLNRTTLSIGMGKSSQLTATVSPNNASNKSVIWATSNSAVATVDAAGNVTAKAVGKATITVTTADRGYTAKCSVTVTKK